jgi:hypothetical protein
VRGELAPRPCPEIFLTALDRYMANEWDRSNRQKRGGGRQLVSLDEQNTEMRYLAEPAGRRSPDQDESAEAVGDKPRHLFAALS